MTITMNGTRDRRVAADGAAPALFCVACNKNPRLAALDRCKECIRAAAAKDRDTRSAAEARVSAKAQRQEALEKLGTLMLEFANTEEGARFLESIGADAIKVGVGPGRGCRTRLETAAGVPQLQAIREAWCAVGESVPIIADGGVKDDKDIFLALICGASTVMMGSALSGTDVEGMQRVGACARLGGALDYEFTSRLFFGVGMDGEAYALEGDRTGYDVMGNARLSFELGI